MAEIRRDKDKKRPLIVALYPVTVKEGSRIDATVNLFIKLTSENVILPTK